MRKANWNAQQAARRKGIRYRDRMKTTEQLRKSAEKRIVSPNNWVKAYESEDKDPVPEDSTEGLFFTFLKQIFIVIIFFAVLCWLVSLL